MKSKMGSCMTGRHVTCPARREPMPWPNHTSRKKGAAYLLNEIVCACPCHTRPVELLRAAPPSKESKR